MVLNEGQQVTVTNSLDQCISNALVSKKDWIEQPIVSLWSHKEFAAAILVRPPRCETSVWRSVNTTFLWREEIVILVRMTWKLSAKGLYILHQCHFVLMLIHLSLYCNRMGLAIAFLAFKSGRSNQLMGLERTQLRQALQAYSVFHV